ncbi:hypothetical protein [Sandarakinorhabdus sp.]|jgi:hypothetical protein|uniref:hypothetical protein n=1 Tax=Sandarakinorhabdus sp. TaxID=1916663 RepID=UPI00333F471C
MMGDAMAALLRRRMQGLAAAAVARLGARVAQRWAGQGVVSREGDTVRLLGPGLRQRWRGSRDRVPDAELLWPGADLGERS